jgi:hypothetical protein
VLAIAAQINSATAGCRFTLGQWDRHYTCEYTGAIVRNENDILDFSGEHLSNRDNSHVWSVVFSNSQMETIPSNIFDVFPNLDSITAIGVGMNRLSVGALRNCDNLMGLNLAENAITRLDNGVLRNCFNLHILDFSNNKISSIGENVFNSLPLVEIHLDHNQLADIPERLFQNMALNILDLSFNRIARISSTMFNGNWLNTLDLTHNQITHIPDRAFADFRLARLSLNNNLISSIGVGAFSAVGRTSGGRLLLNDNRITRLNSNVFDGVNSNVVFLDISNNGINEIEDTFFSFMLDARDPTITIMATGNSCVNQDFVSVHRASVHRGMATCYANF